MSNFKQNGIQFTVTNANSSARPFKFYNGTNGDFSDAQTDGLEPFINGVEIDWNGAVLPNSDLSTGSSVTINTTGELLSLIDQMQQEIYTLAAAVIAIGQNN